MGYLFLFAIFRPPGRRCMCANEDSDLSTMDPTPPPPLSDKPAGAPVVAGWHDQDGVLRDMWLKNQTPQAIAEALGRSVPAVMTRAARLGLPRRSAPGRKPTMRTERTDGTERQTAPRAKPVSQQAAEASQTSMRVCLMCLNKFESAGRHNRICSTCKNSAEYATASTLPQIDLPSV